MCQLPSLELSRHSAQIVLDSVEHSCHPKLLKHKHETKELLWSTQAFM
ncbi:mCG1044312 [Mus musculus]|nr:mCG1044312 [Mus musculus]